MVARLVVFALLLVWSGSGLSRAQEASSDARFLAGLRSRHLYRLAEAYCMDRLAESDLDDQVRADLVIQLSETYVQHARHSAPEEADAYWAPAFELAQKYTDEFPDSPWRVPVRFQAAKVLLDRAEMARERAELLGNDVKLLNEARGYLRITIEQFKQQAAEVQQVIQRTERGPMPPGPARWQWLSLQKHIDSELARAFQNQGLAYPDRSADRDNALRQALELLEPLSRLATVDPLAWSARIDQIACLRGMHDLAGAQRKLDQLQKEEPPSGVEQQALAEQLRVLLAAGQLERAVSLAGQVSRSTQGNLAAQLEFAMLEVVLAKWKHTLAAEATEESKVWQQQASAMVARLEQRHGSYWARRAENLLGSVTTSKAVPGDQSLALRAAEGAYRSGELDKAVALYEQASSSAQQQRRMDEAVRLASLAGQIEYQREHWESATRRLRAAAMLAPESQLSAEAHLLAIYAAAQLARADSAKLAEYQQLLQEHLEHWPQAKSAGTVWYYRAQSEEFSKRWREAIGAYLHVPSEDEKFAKAVQGVGRCYHALLATATAKEEPTEALAREAALYFETLIFGRENQWPELWSAAELDAALRAVDFRLRYGQGGEERCESILRTALLKAPQASPEWKASAKVLLAMALIHQQKFADAEQILGDVSQGSPVQLFVMLQGLSEIAQSATQRDREQLARLQLHAARLLGSRLNQLTPAQQRLAEVATCQALADVGQWADAVKRAKALHAAHPRNADVLELLAALLSQGSKATDWEAALLRWRELEHHSRTGTPRWYRAKYHLAETYAKLGKRERAAQIVNVTKILHPDLGGPELKSKFEALLQKVQSAAP